MRSLGRLELSLTEPQDRSALAPTRRSVGQAGPVDPQRVLS
jgi:hypothetical protein